MLSDRKMLIVFWALQAFNVFATLLNVAIACWNFIVEKYEYSAVSAAVAATLVVSFVHTQRKYARMQREEREHAERLAEEFREDQRRYFLRVGGTRRIPLENFLIKPQWTSQQELERCYELTVCPDCTAQSLDIDHNPELMKTVITCRDPRCGSQFTVDINGEWSRRE